MATRIRTTGENAERLEPAEFAAAIGAQPVSGSRRSFAVFSLRFPLADTRHLPHLRRFQVGS